MNHGVYWGRTGVVGIEQEGGGEICSMWGRAGGCGVNGAGVKGRNRVKRRQILVVERLNGPVGK